jgi:membrane protein required for beta-lactamase induction
MRLPITAQALQLIRHASSLLTDVRDLGRDFVELATLEAKLAKASLISIGVLSGAVALLLFTGWILIIFSAVAWLAEDWLSLPVSLLVVGLTIAAGAVPLFLMIKRHSGNLDFKATRRRTRRSTW